ncbi:hypothetical protein DFJ74DRAFT_515155 [Hyaloraphidium curvatum]|nr:hypothetical protein DFJ74DRAFT_515155 [Hyaloraphidium curvatum]
MAFSFRSALADFTRRCISSCGVAPTPLLTVRSLATGRRLPGTRGLFGRGTVCQQRNQSSAATKIRDDVRTAGGSRKTRTSRRSGSIEPARGALPAKTSDKGKKLLQRRLRGRTAKEVLVTHTASSGKHVVEPFRTKGIKVRRWRVKGFRRAKKKAKPRSEGKGARNKYPANPLRLLYDNSHLLSAQIKWMVGEKDQFAEALELIRRHAVKDRHRELQAREARRDIAARTAEEKDSSAVEETATTAPNKELATDENEEQSETEDAPVDDDLLAVWNTFLNQCATKGQFGWAELGYRMMLHYRSKPDRITRLALLSALGNAATMSAKEMQIPQPINKPGAQADSEVAKDPLPVPWSKHAMRDFYLPSVLARIPATNFDTMLLNALLKVLARCEDWSEFDVTVSRFVFGDPAALFPGWVLQVGTTSLNPKYQRERPKQSRKVAERHYLTQETNAPQPDKVTLRTVLSHLARRRYRPDEPGLLERMQNLWRHFVDELGLKDKDAELVNALLTCVLNSGKAELTPLVAAQEFGLPMDRPWDGSAAEEIANPKRRQRSTRGRQRRRNDGTAVRSEGGQPRSYPSPDVKTLSILLESVLRTSGQAGIDGGNLVLGWWKEGLFDTVRHDATKADLAKRRVPAPRSDNGHRLDDYAAFLLMRTVGLVSKSRGKGQGFAALEQTSEDLWTIFNVMIASSVLDKSSPRTAGVVLDACWKAVGALSDMPLKEMTAVYPGGKRARLEVWASRAGEIWKPHEKRLRDLARPSTAEPMPVEETRTLLYLMITYSRVLIDLHHELRNKDHVAKVLTTGLAILRASRPERTWGNGPERVDCRLKRTLASTLRKLANEAISDATACGEFVMDIKGTGWYSSEVKWDSRMGQDGRTRSEDARHPPEGRWREGIDHVRGNTAIRHGGPPFRGDDMLSSDGFRKVA